jgi:hypothetical protein
MSAGYLFVSLIAGALGTGYFVYGRRQGEGVPMLAGAGLCILPFFVGNLLLLVVLSAALLAAPFLLRS